MASPLSINLDNDCYVGQRFGVLWEGTMKENQFIETEY